MNEKGMMHFLTGCIHCRILCMFEKRFPARLSDRRCVFSIAERLKGDNPVVPVPAEMKDKYSRRLSCLWVRWCVLAVLG